MVGYVATGATGASGMSNAVTSLLEVGSSVLTMVSGNEVLMTFFCAGIVFIGIGIVKKLK